MAWSTRAGRTAALSALVCWSVSACSAPRVHNTRLTGADLVAMTDAMVESLANDPDIAGHGWAAWIVVTDRVVNHTNDIVPRREQRAYLARLRVLLNAADLPGMRFVRSAELSGAQRAVPTHALTATFHALTQTERLLRSDAYLCTFQLLDLRSDLIIWEDRYEVKYEIVRSEMD